MEAEHPVSANAPRECDCPKWVVACIHPAGGRVHRIIQWSLVPSGVDPHQGCKPGKRYATYEQGLADLRAAEEALLRAGA